MAFGDLITATKVEVRVKTKCPACNTYYAGQGVWCEIDQRYECPNCTGTVSDEKEEEDDVNCVKCERSMSEATAYYCESCEEYFCNGDYKPHTWECDCGEQHHHEY